jgi:hypothetical protein
MSTRHGVWWKNKTPHPKGPCDIDMVRFRQVYPAMLGAWILMGDTSS